MYNHNKAQQSKNRVHISWDILSIVDFRNMEAISNTMINTNWVEFEFIWRDDVHRTTFTMVELWPEFAPTNDTPYLALTGELWGVVPEILKENNHDTHKAHCVPTASVWRMFRFVVSLHKQHVSVDGFRTVFFRTIWMQTCYMATDAILRFWVIFSGSLYVPVTFTILRLKGWCVPGVSYVTFVIKRGKQCHRESPQVGKSIRTEVGNMVCIGYSGEDLIRVDCWRADNFVILSEQLCSGCFDILIM